MADGELSVKIVVDAADLNSGIKQAASTVSSASEQMAQATLRYASAQNTLRDAVRQYVAGDLPNLAIATKLVAQAQSEAVAAATQLKEAKLALIPPEKEAVGLTNELNEQLKKVPAEAEAAAGGINNARAAMMGLNRELGLGGNRALSTFIGQSETLGPILNKAFTGIAIVGFIQLAQMAGEKLSDLIAKTWIFTDAQKQMLAEQVGANAAMAQAGEQHARMLREIALLGKPLEEQAKMRAQFAREDADGVAGTLAQQEKALALARQQLQVLEQKARTPVAHVHAAAGMTDIFPDMTKEISAQERAIDSLSAKIGVLRAQYTVAMDAVAEATKKGSIDTTKDAEKEQENWAREQQRLGHEQEEEAVRRGEAERRAIEEKERLDEEDSAHSMEMAKRDLETWRTKLVEKTRITEEQGKAQLEQIRANADLLEKTTAGKSLRGTADPAIAQEARAATERQVAVIEQMIAAETQLQQTLKATGAAQDDPKIDASLRRQAELTQQINKAWDDYGKKVQQVAAAEMGFVRGELGSLFSSVNSNLVQMANGQQTVSLGLQKIWTSVVDGILVDFAKLGEKWIEQHLIMAAASKLFHLQDAANAATSAAAATAAAKVSGVAQVGLAGAGGVASMAAAAFPIDLTAPAFGSAMAAAASGLLAFESGGMVPGFGPVPAIVHGGEMILNQEQQRALGAGGNHTFHYHAHGNGGTEQARSNAKDFFRLARREMRRMNR